MPGLVGVRIETPVRAWWHGRMDEPQSASTKPASRERLVTTDPTTVEFTAFLAPGIAPVSDGEVELIKRQMAGLLQCEAADIKPSFVELGDLDAIEREFSWIPKYEQSRERLLSLIALLRHGAQAAGNRCCMLVYDAGAPISAIDYLQALAEITRLPVLLGVFRQPLGGDLAQRQILVRRMR